MNDKIDGICIGGKFYKRTISRKKNPCDACDLVEKCKGGYCIGCIGAFGEKATLKFSQELTDKLNGLGVCICNDCTQRIPINPITDKLNGK